MEENNIKNKDNDLLFNIFDYQYVNIIVFETFGVLWMMSMLSIKNDNLLAKNMLEVAIISIIVSIIFKSFVVHFNKKKFFLNFFKHKIIRNYDLLDMDINQDIEIHKLSSLWYIGHKSIKRPTILMKIVGYLVAIITFPLLLLVNFCLAIYYKKFLIQEILVVIGKNDKEVIVIAIPRNDIEKQQQLREYFLQYTNVDIDQLETLKFIPQKG